jgi:hypothetical protein
VGLGLSGLGFVALWARRRASLAARRLVPGVALAWRAAALVWAPPAPGALAWAPDAPPPPLWEPPANATEDTRISKAPTAFLMSYPIAALARCLKGNLRLPITVFQGG